MVKGKKESINSECIVIEKEKNKNIVSDTLFYVMALIVSFILIFATSSFLNSIHYLFVIIFAIIAVIAFINFIMDKDYEKGNYSSITIAIMSVWASLFVFKYGSFLFLEMFPVLVSLFLFLVSISSLTKYFDFKNKANLIVTIISIVLGILLVFLPKDITYIVFKIVGAYIFVIVILDFINYKKYNTNK